MSAATHIIPTIPAYPWLAARTVLYVVHGSRAYGTSRPDSDYDFKGVAVAPRQYRDGFAHTFDQAQTAEPDATVFDLRKFLALAADGNPNIVEVLWVADADRLVCTAAGALLVAARGQLLSRKARFTFSGYAVAQLKRIQTHHKWLRDPPQRQPQRRDFGLPERHALPPDQLAAAEAAIRKQVDSWELDLSGCDAALRLHIHSQLERVLGELHLGSEQRPRAAGRLLGFDDNFLELLDAERHYKSARDNWRAFQTWQTSRNPARSALEAQHGYDTKHAMHLVRLLRMCREILTEGQVLVRRPDAQELLAIRAGAWSYDRLLAWAAEQDAELGELEKVSSLPRAPDREQLDQLCLEITALVDRQP